MREVGEKCAVFGVYGKGLDAARLTFFGLYALQHRGQESSGLVTTDGTDLYSHKGMGLVSHVYDEAGMQALHGHVAIGHNRYSTSGGSSAEHIQPFVIREGKDRDAVVLAHNGNIPSTKALENFLNKKGISPDQGTLSDSRMIVEALGCLMREGMDIEDAIREVFPLMTGAFSILIMTKNKLIALRDSFGIRPLSIGTLNGGYIFSSETCALHPMGALHLRDVAPGEMVIVDESGLRSAKLTEGTQKLDVFEFVYFSRPDSVLLGKSVYEVRKNFGIELAKECPLEADVVIPVPETAIPVAIGYARATGIPFETGLIKNKYIHRTFIEPEQHMREQGVKVKLTPLSGVLKDKRVIVTDDSIVRGTTSKQIVKMLFDAGAREVHFLVSSPPVMYPDFYGIDIPRQDGLLAATKSIEEIREYLGATSLHFLSYEGMIRATGIPEDSLCTSCFSGKYPIDIQERRAEIDFSNGPSRSVTLSKRASQALS